MPSDNIFQFPKAARAAQPERFLIPSRLRDARKAARLTQADLGDIAGVTRQAISSYERGDKSPEPATFSKISEALSQPAIFFTSPDAPSFGEHSARFFRKTGSDTVRRNDACAVFGNWFVQTVKYFDNFVNYPEVMIPEFSPKSQDGRYSPDEIDEIAASVRRHWGLGSGPLSNVISLVESKGVIVCHYEMTGENVEAFSFWSGNRPFIFMASEKEAGVRRRYDVAHELGHLILHRWVEQSEIEDKNYLKIIESEANRFAGAFLLPKKSFPNEIYTTRLDSFIPLKERWRVSIQAMIYRCRDLEIIDDDQYLNLYKQISFRRWRKVEPLDDPVKIPIEQPQILRRAVRLVLENGRKHPDDIVQELRFNPKLIEAFCGLPAGTLDGNGSESVKPTLK